MSNPAPPPVDAAPVPNPAPRRLAAPRFGRVALLAIPGCYLVLVFLWPSGFGYWRVCTTCGEIEHVSQRYLPLTRIAYRTARRPQPTALSREVAQLNIRPSHAHRWEFGSGNGYGFGRSCALGNAHMLLNVVDQPDVAMFVRQLNEYVGPEPVDEWLNLLLDPATGFAARSAVRVAGFPEKGCATEQDFVRWWVANRQKMLDVVRQSR